MTGIRCNASNPIEQIDAVFVDSVFQPLVDRFGIDPRKTSHVMLVLHAMCMAAMHSAASALEAAGTPVMSRLETGIGLPAVALFQLAFLWVCMRRPSFYGSAGLDGVIRVMYLSFSILTVSLLPRTLFGEAAPEFLDAWGRTPFALRGIAIAFAGAMATATAALYLSICRRPPPKRRMAWA